MGQQHDATISIDAADLAAILADQRPVLVSFEAQGCTPCLALAPRLERVAREFGARVLVVRVAGADEPSMAARYHLLCVPTLAFWLGGRERLRMSGAVSAEALRSHLLFLLENGPIPEPAVGPRRVVRGSFRPRASH
jgi:thioredoxin